MTAPRFGRPLHVFDEVTSTNDIALDLVREGAPEGAAVIAGSQTRGRGRDGRTWLSAPGRGLWLSIVLRPGLTYPDSGLLPVVAGSGLVLALRDLGLPALVKWPNDIWVRGRKIAGVLVESCSNGGRLEAAVVGVGLNCLLPASENLRYPVTALRVEAEAAGVVLPSREAVLDIVLDRLERAYLLLKAAGPHPFLRAWPSLSAHHGRPVTAFGPAGKMAGLSGPLQPDGCLELLLPDGERRLLNSAELGLHAGPPGRWEERAGTKVPDRP
ncbi:MAG: biotin--[acetyl-CoA-carboxylase] ligase [Bacillota bacterium]